MKCTVPNKKTQRKHLAGAKSKAFFIFVRKELLDFPARNFLPFTHRGSVAMVRGKGQQTEKEEASGNGKQLGM